jgi:hypothetical protein
MKIDKPFHIRIQPDYLVNEPMTERDRETTTEMTERLGGIVFIEGEETEDTTFTRTGGRIDWFMFNEPESNKPEINVNIMRIWALQLVTQMVNDKSYVNEIQSEPKFGVNEEEKETFLKVIVDMTKVLHKELNTSIESVVIKNKPYFNFTKNGE